MSAFFFDRHAAITDLQHVRVVPAVGARSLEMLLTLFEVELNGSPSIEDVLRGAPGVGGLRSPLPGLLLAPIARGEEDGAASRDESVSHVGVASSRWQVIIEAVVILEVVNTPAREISSVSLLMVE